MKNVSILLLIAALFLPGCRHAASPASPWQSVAIDAPPPGLVLMQAPADGTNVLRDLHGALAALEGRKSAARLFLGAAVSWDDATLKASPGARKVAIDAIYHSVQAGVLGEQFRQIRDLVDRMVKLAPTAAETHFALAYLRWILLSDGKKKSARASLADDVIRDLHNNLDALVKKYPTFDGPGDFDRQRIRIERDQVALMLSGAVTPTHP
ncbi:MAG: hypothetical protein KC502_05135 [Myxococcales bacterium]|nr:hypothetical protein [Myxococcales bacterium]